MVFQENCGISQIPYTYNTGKTLVVVQYIHKILIQMWIYLTPKMPVDRGVYFICFSIVKKKKKQSDKYHYVSYLKS